MKANEGGTLYAEGYFDGCGYLRLLDVTDPGNIVQKDAFATEGVLPIPLNCRPFQVCSIEGIKILP